MGATPEAKALAAALHIQIEETRREGDLNETDG